MWLTLTERQSRKSRSPKAVFVFGSLFAGLRAAPGSEPSQITHSMRVSRIMCRKKRCV